MYYKHLFDVVKAMVLYGVQVVMIAPGGDGIWRGNEVTRARCRASLTALHVRLNLSAPRRQQTKHCQVPTTPSTHIKRNTADERKL